MRPAIAVAGGDLGQPGEDIQLGQGAGRAQQPAGAAADFDAHLLEQTGFNVEDAPLGVEHERLVFLELGSDVALGVDQGLLADVVVGRVLALAAAQLNVVSKDFVVADLQRADAGALALHFFQAGDP